MPQGSTRDTIVSFANLVATYALPSVVSGVVTRVLPAVADMLIPPDMLDAYVNDGGNISQIITTEDGQQFQISISQVATPQVHDVLLRAHKSVKSSTGSGLQRQQQYIGLLLNQSQIGDKAGSGGISILNGIIGINWG